MRTRIERRAQLLYRLIILAIVALAILLLPSCREAEPADLSLALAEVEADLGVVAPADHAHAHAHAHEGDGMEISGHSLFHLDSEWWDQTGERRKLDSLGGRVQVVSMVYTHCAYACPRIMGDMKRIEGELGPDAAGRVGYVLVSIDPERDTPERLARFAADLHLDHDQWTLLSSEEGGVLELAAVLGVRYARESATDFGHTNLIAVLSPTGEVVHRQLGVGEGVPATVRAIERQLESL